jgi:hypothetical protein
MIKIKTVAALALAGGLVALGVGQSRLEQQTVQAASNDRLAPHFLV